MRIGLVVGRVGRGSGTAGVAWSLAAHLVERGHEVGVFTADPAEVPAGVEVRPFGVPGRGWLSVALDRIPGCRVVRASGGVHRAWGRVRRTTLLRWGRQWRPRDRREARNEALALAGAEVVVCNAHRAAAEVSAWHGIPPPRIRVVRNGVALDRFRPDPDRRAEIRQALGIRGRVALFVGHGWYRKGFATAVEAFGRVAGPHDRFVVLGRDARRRRHLRRARARLGDRLVALPPSDPARWLPAADVLIHPTRYDASANTVLEAMAAGVPPVTTSRDGAAEIVADRRLVVGNPDDVGGVAMATRYAWEAQGLPARCRDVAESWPTSRMVVAMERILEELRDG